MNPPDLAHVLARLSTRRPVFHSEADFQHNFAHELRAVPSVTGLRLERPFRFETETINLDILVHTTAGPVAIELKYWRKAGSIDHEGEAYEVRSDGAEDLGRYDFWKDVARIERLVEAGAARWGAAITLSNHSGYWNPARNGDTLDAAFRLSDGREVAGTLAWPRKTGTTKGREAAISLAGCYRVAWKPNSALGGGFRTLTIVVAREA